MRLIAITRGQSAPSARFRFRQYLPQFAEAGVDATERYAPAGATAPPGSAATRLRWLARAIPYTAVTPLAARRFDAVLLQKPLLTNRRTVEPLLLGGYAFDVDDAIWHRAPKGIDAIANRAGVVIAGNAYLAEHFDSIAPTVVLPTGVDLQRWAPTHTTPPDQPTIVWSGGHTGFADLALAAPALSTVLQRQPHVRLRIMADLPPPASLGLPADSVDYVRWSPEVEVAAIASATVGIMPLRDSDWARGKCAYKMLLYLACGVPAVVSPVGMNTEVAAVARAATTLASSTEEWVEALEARLLDPSAAVRDGLTGRQAISEPYSAESVGRRLTEIVKGLT